MTSDPLHLEYEACVMLLLRRADDMRRDSLPPEAIARAIRADRRRLSQTFKERTPEPLRTRIYERTLAVYGDPLGLTLEDLRAKMKSWHDVIGCAVRPAIRLRMVRFRVRKWRFAMTTALLTFRASTACRRDRSGPVWAWPRILQTLSHRIRSA
jgi:hypothetical protein